MESVVAGAQSQEHAHRAHVRQQHVHLLVREDVGGALEPGLEQEIPVLSAEVVVDHGLLPLDLLIVLFPCNFVEELAV